MALLKLNRHLYFLDCDSIEIKEVSAGRFKVRFDNYHEFLVVGGKAAGGAQHEWFCYEPRLYGEKWIPAKSKIAAIRLGVQY